MFFIFLLYVYYGILYNGVSMLFLRHLCLIMYFGISILYAQDINEISNNIPMSPQSTTTTPTTQPMIPLNETRKLELAGDDTFGYDISNKIRKSKSNFNVGIGMNIVRLQNTNIFRLNASVLAGYSYFFHKTIGFRGYAFFDNMATQFYTGAGIDVLWDFIQTEQFGLGVIVGSSVGYVKSYNISGAGDFLGQFHVGIGMTFDSGKSRLEGLTRIPYNQINLLGNIERVDITYIIMYSYTF